MSGILSYILVPVLLTIASDPVRFQVSTNSTSNSLHNKRTESVDDAPTTPTPTGEESVDVDPEVSPEEYIQQAVSIMMERIQQLDISNEFPPSLLILLNKIKKLTIGSSDWRNAVHGIDDPTSPTEKPEYGVYIASICALLFLRLICPAIIAPLEWNVLHNEWDRRHSRISKSDNNISKENANTSSPAMFIILLAHVLHSGNINRADGDSQTDSNDSSCNHLYSIWSGNNDDLAPVIAAIQVVVNEVPVTKVKQLHDQFKSSEIINQSNSLDSSTLLLFQLNSRLSGETSGVENEDEIKNKERAMLIRKSLIEVAKQVQKLANQACSSYSAGAIPESTKPTSASYNILKAFCENVGNIVI